ncbi:hypothetical protein LCGC14_1111150 [marine sediment metagenome]|uniref:Uncharacterized protein n=1 Tax=marine sediment metagenome TaxID=412755 RepID=A0A0F9QCS2_9ZZZZ
MSGYTLSSFSEKDPRGRRRVGVIIKEDKVFSGGVDKLLIVCYSLYIKHKGVGNDIHYNTRD